MILTAIPFVKKYAIPFVYITTLTLCITFLPLPWMLLGLGLLASVMIAYQLKIRSAAERKDYLSTQFYILIFVTLMYLMMRLLMYMTA